MALVNSHSQHNGRKLTKTTVIHWRFFMPWPKIMLMWLKN